MSGFPDSIRYLAVCLVAVYALADGHLLCTLCHSANSIEQAAHDCGHSQCLPPEIPSPTHCCSDNCEEHLCDTAELPDIILSRSGDKPVNPLSVSFVVFNSDISVEYQPSLIGFRTITSHPSAPSLRLHLLYEVLVI